jgi:hypothetical protein
MGYFWDQLDRSWIPRPRWERTKGEKRRASRRHRLLDELIAEIEDDPIKPPAQFVGQDAEYFTFTQHNDRAAKLYAALLARALIGTDEVLMKERGKEIAELTAGGELITPLRADHLSTK